MTTLTVMYPAAGTTFDRAYYADHHIPLVRSSWGDAGLTRVDVVFGDEAMGGGDAPFHCVATLHFTDRAALDAAAGGAAAPAVFADIANFTDSTSVALVGVAG